MSNSTEKTAFRATIPNSESTDYNTNFLPKLETLKTKNGIKSNYDLLKWLVAKVENMNATDTCSGKSGVEFSDTAKPVGYELTERELIDHATQHIPLERLLYKGALAEAKRLHSESQRNDTKQVLRGNRLESYQKIDSAVKEQIAINQKGKFLTQRLITSAWIQKESGCNFPAIKEYLTINQPMIDEHHAKLGLDENQNRKVMRALKKGARPTVASVDNEDNE